MWATGVAGLSSSGWRLLERESLGFGTLLLLPLLLCDMLGLGMYAPKLGRGAGCWCSGLRVKISALAVRRSAIVGGMLR